MQQNAAVELRNITKTFGARPDLIQRLAIKAGLAKVPPTVHAVNDVSLTIKQGEVVGLVGESGCGKSTLGRIVAGINEPTSGGIFRNGIDTKGMTGAELQAHALQTQMIFQNPFAALNPRMTISSIVSEAPRHHRLYGDDLDGFVDQQLLRAGFDPSMKGRYPHQFSGGQRQRINIARALSVNPKFLVCDESVAALDVSIQAQIINLFMDLKESLGLTYLFISHDLGVVEHISDRVVIMYLGRIVEEAPASEIFKHPNHPYTKALVDEIPKIDTSRRDFSVIKGELPSPLSPPSGCHFHPRCPQAMPICKEQRPEYRLIASDHMSACHLND
ncbi:ABC transporter ATP-binding protein [Pseudomonas asiatica]|uniref:ABC transporter ATP-binding protein n=1 Tax=Pseudomonas asiatica TaxID=2219225 RepID=UPI00383A84C1